MSTTTPLIGLRALREKAGHSQAAAAAVIGSTQSAYRKFETGVVRLDLARAKMLADWLGCKMEELL